MYRFWILARLGKLSKLRLENSLILFDTRDFLTVFSTSKMSRNVRSSVSQVWNFFWYISNIILQIHVFVLSESSPLLSDLGRSLQKTIERRKNNYSIARIIWPSFIRTSQIIRTIVCFPIDFNVWIIRTFYLLHTNFSRIFCENYPGPIVLFRAWCLLLVEVK